MLSPLPWAAARTRATLPAPSRLAPRRPAWSCPQWGGQMHGPNECANEDQLKQALKIYIVAILRLNELEL